MKEKKMSYEKEMTKSSSKVYHISPVYLRNLRVEVSGGRRMRRERDNAYDGKDEVKGWTYEQRVERYDTLKESIKQDGFKEEFPVIIMLRREGGEDKLFEGHHRLNIAIELGLATIPVRFIEWEKEYNAKGNWVDK
jgi:hypothetical protein